MENLTKLEEQVLLAVINSDYQMGEYEERINNPTWYLDEDDVNMKPGQLSGAISSCVKKGYVGIAKDGNDSTIWITELGYEKIKHVLNS